MKRIRRDWRKLDKAIHGDETEYKKTIEKLKTRVNNDGFKKCLRENKCVWKKPEGKKTKEIIVRRKGEHRRE